MFDIGIKPDDCAIDITTQGDRAKLRYVEYFDIETNIVTDTYITQTMDALKYATAIMEKLSEDVKIELSSKIMDNCYVVYLNLEAKKDDVYFSIIGEMLAQIGNVHTMEQLSTLVEGLKMMFSAELIDHKYVKDAIHEYADVLKNMEELDEELYDAILHRAVELSKNDRKGKKSTPA